MKLEATKLKNSFTFVLRTAAENTWDRIVNHVQREIVSESQASTLVPYHRSLPCDLGKDYGQDELRAVLGGLEHLGWLFGALPESLAMQVLTERLDEHMIPDTPLACDGLPLYSEAPRWAREDGNVVRLDPGVDPAAPGTVRDGLQLALDRLTLQSGARCAADLGTVLVAHGADRGRTFLEALDSWEPATIHGVRVKRCEREALNGRGEFYLAASGPMAPPFRFATTDILDLDRGETTDPATGWKRPCITVTTHARIALLNPRACVKVEPSEIVVAQRMPAVAA